MSNEHMTSVESARIFAQKLVRDLAAADCGDNSCKFARAKGGMRTNGGCRCANNVEAAIAQRDAAIRAQAFREAADVIFP
jgi:hypothetical protein